MEVHVLLVKATVASFVFLPLGVPRELPRAS